MAMLGMQADMPCHYYPGYCSTRDLNLNNVGAFPRNGHYYNGNLAPPYTDQYLAYKEKLKQIMLQHEAIFKDQILELHRVYNRQRELMDEMRRVKFYGHHLQVETLQSSQTCPGNSFDYSQKMCKVSAPPLLNPAFSPSSISRAENNQPPLNYLEGKITSAGCSTVRTEVCREESELLKSKFKKVGKKILDLELPAYEYIDSEQEESLAWEAAPLEGPSYLAKSIVDDVQKHGVELSHKIADGNVVFQDDDTTRASFSMRTKLLADLNEPIKLEEETDPESNDFLSPVSDPREIPCHDLSGEKFSDFQFQPKETIQISQTVGDPEPFSNVLHLEKNETRRECLSGNDETGKSSSGLSSFPQRTCTETLSTSSEEDEIEQAQESLTSHLSIWCNGKLERNRKPFGLESCPGQIAAACKHASGELIPLDEVMNCDSSVLSSWRKHTQELVRAPIAVQALPCFNSPVRLSRSSKFQNPQITGDKSYLDINVESEAKLQSSSPQSNFCDSDNVFASDVKGTKVCIEDSMDLILTKDIDLNCGSPGCSSDVAAQSIWLTDGEEKCEESAGGSPLRKADLASFVEANKKFELDCNSVPDSGEQLTANELVLGKKLGKKSSGFGFQVDLNSYIHEDGSLLLPSVPSILDLQAPKSPENEEGSPPRGESDENQHETPCILSEQENGDLLEDLVTIAAEAIVSISLSEPQNETENETFRQPEAAESVSLHWFAKLASSIVDDPESEFGVVLSCRNPDDQDEYLSDGIDYFEAMTLKLESKEEEYCCKANVQKEEVACPDSLPSQPRRGRTRRGRQQQKDFQSEILPSLASLSRYEVTEDLQVIGGLIEAARRSTGARTGRIGWTTGRRRRRRTSMSSSKAESSACTASRQQSRQGECRIEDWSLIGWGKKTRRRRGHRSPASKPGLILSQVGNST
ncbi:uncharacterized protein LOC8284482 [Ricinus communis]|uniref:uncharacterized protein LOC8284482 n=1 Tax=Ricinus communis TaxID=3988 RepID=UPI00201B13B0|nr:uncharacterized protein LOC8284482 [Ricinus communis]